MSSDLVVLIGQPLGELRGTNPAHHDRVLVRRGSQFVLLPGKYAEVIDLLRVPRTIGEIQQLLGLDVAGAQDLLRTLDDVSLIARGDHRLQDLDFSLIRLAPVGLGRGFDAPTGMHAIDAQGSTVLVGPLTYAVWSASAVTDTLSIAIDWAANELELGSVDVIADTVRMELPTLLAGGAAYLDLGFTDHGSGEDVFVD